MKRITLISLIAAAVTVAVAATAWLFWPRQVRIDPSDSGRVARGQLLYAEHCAACHGAQLEGQPDWQSRNAQGRLPAPPHDASGHTWHHDDQVLFEVTKYGITKHAPPGYASDMPAFAGPLDDQAIVDVLAFIKSRWPPSIHDKRREGGMN